MLMLMARYQACIPDTVRLCNAEQGYQTDAAWGPTCVDMAFEETDSVHHD